jgi:hypothetical protein
LSDLPSWPALLADAGPPIIVPDVVEVHDLAALNPTQAAALDGKRALFRVVIDGPADRPGSRQRRSRCPLQAGDGICWEVTKVLADPGLVRVLGIPVVAPGPDGGRVTAAAPAHSRAVGR